MSQTVPRDYEGRSVVVTGAGAGIGRAIALRLARGGARLVCVDIDEASVTTVAKRDRGRG
jgi:3-oxoacyl-[acyl-carrier protein] reductase